MDSKERQRAKDLLRARHGPDFPIVEEINGQLVLDDPAALGMIRAVEAHNRSVAIQNCIQTFSLNAERIAHFRKRIGELGKTGQDYVIVVLNVDDYNGGHLAELLMPGHNWQPLRDQGQTPFARGLAVREGIQEILDKLDPVAGGRLRGEKGIAVVVMDHGIVQVESAEGF